jgi:hypothetical protein
MLFINQINLNQIVLRVTHGGFKGPKVRKRDNYFLRSLIEKMGLFEKEPKLRPTRILNLKAC